jgi:hypothetical protein
MRWQQRVHLADEQLRLMQQQSGHYMAMRIFGRQVVA